MDIGCVQSVEDFEESGESGESEEGEESEEYQQFLQHHESNNNQESDVSGDANPAPTPVYKPVRRNQFKMPEYNDFENMKTGDRKFIYKKSRLIQARQLHLIAALQQQLNAERTTNALLMSDDEATFRLDVETPYDKCEFPREVGNSYGPANWSRADSDWVILRRTKHHFDLKIVHVDKSGECSTADAYMGNDEMKPLPIVVTLCDEIGNKIETPFLSLGDDNKDRTLNELTFDMKTNVTRVALMIKTTSSFLKSMGIGDGKVLLKFGTWFDNKRLEFKTRPFYITQRISTGKVDVEPWNLETLNAVCDECAHCSKLLKTGRIVKQ